MLAVYSHFFLSVCSSCEVYSLVKYLFDFSVNLRHSNLSLRVLSCQPGCVGVKILALKFMETFILLFTPDGSDPEKFAIEGIVF